MMNLSIVLYIQLLRAEGPQTLAMGTFSPKLWGPIQYKLEGYDHKQAAVQKMALLIIVYHGEV